MNRDITRKLLEVAAIPTLPQVMHRILETLENDSSSAQDITRILECDHAISARVLRLANSAFYGLRYKADTIRKAVVVLGFDAVRMLALATSVFGALNRQDQFAFSPEDFWLHSLGTAKAAQLLVKKSGGNTSHDGCFTAGLLHDLGKYILALVLKEQYKAIVKQAEESQIQLYHVEQQQLGMTHTEAGKWIAERWRFPSLISDVIGNQQDVTGYRGPHRLEVAIVALSSDISRALEFGNAGDFKPPNLQSDRIIELGLDPNPVSRVLEELEDYPAEAKDFLHILQQV